MHLTWQEPSPVPAHKKHTSPWENYNRNVLDVYYLSLFYRSLIFKKNYIYYIKLAKYNSYKKIL